MGTFTHALTESNHCDCFCIVSAESRNSVHHDQCRVLVRMRESTPLTGPSHKLPMQARGAAVQSCTSDSYVSTTLIQTTKLRKVTLRFVHSAKQQLVHCSLADAMTSESDPTASREPDKSLPWWSSRIGHRITNEVSCLTLVTLPELIPEGS